MEKKQTMSAKKFVQVGNLKDNIQHEKLFVKTTIDSNKKQYVVNTENKIEITPIFEKAKQLLESNYIEKLNNDEYIKSYTIEGKSYITKEQKEYDYHIRKATIEEIEEKRLQKEKEYIEEYTSYYYGDEEYGYGSTYTNVEKESTHVPVVKISAFTRIINWMRSLYTEQYSPQIQKDIIELKKFLQEDEPHIYIIGKIIEKNKKTPLPEKYQNQLSDRLTYLVCYNESVKDKMELLELLITSKQLSTKHLKEFIFTRDGQSVVSPLLTEMKKNNGSINELDNNLEIKKYPNLFNVMVTSLNNKSFQEELQQELHSNIVKCEKTNPKLYSQYLNKVDTLNDKLGTPFIHRALIPFSKLEAIYKTPYFMEKIYEHTTHEQFLQFRPLLMSSLEVSIVKSLKRKMDLLKNSEYKILNSVANVDNILTTVFEKLKKQYGSVDLSIDEDLVIKPKLENTMGSLPKNAQTIIKEIRFFYQQISIDKKDVNEDIITIEQQHDIDLIISKRIPNTVEKYLSINPSFREKANTSGKNAHQILEENLMDMKEIMFYVLEKINEKKLSNLHVEKRIINNVRDKYGKIEISDTALPKVEVKTSSTDMDNFNKIEVITEDLYKTKKKKL